MADQRGGRGDRLVADPGDGADLPDRYVIEQVRSGRTEARLEIPIPVHPRARRWTRAAALAWAMVHLRYGSACPARRLGIESDTPSMRKKRAVSRDRRMTSTANS
jgi:hypothetical protein